MEKEKVLDRQAVNAPSGEAGQGIKTVNRDPVTRIPMTMNNLMVDDYRPGVEDGQTPR